MAIDWTGMCQICQMRGTRDLWVIVIRDSTSSLWELQGRKNNVISSLLEAPGSNEIC